MKIEKLNFWNGNTFTWEFYMWECKIILIGFVAGFQECNFLLEKIMYLEIYDVGNPLPSVLYSWLWLVKFKCRHELCQNGQGVEIALQSSPWYQKDEKYCCSDRKKG
jgi:hypothetical protein